MALTAGNRSSQLAVLLSDAVAALASSGSGAGKAAAANQTQQRSSRTFGDEARGMQSKAYSSDSCAAAHPRAPSVCEDRVSGPPWSANKIRSCAHTVQLDSRHSPGHARLPWSGVQMRPGARMASRALPATAEQSSVGLMPCQLSMGLLCGRGPASVHTGVIGSDNAAAHSRAAYVTPTCLRAGSFNVSFSSAKLAADHSRAAYITPACLRAFSFNAAFSYSAAFSSASSAQLDAALAHDASRREQASPSTRGTVRPADGRPADGRLASDTSESDTSAGDSTARAIAAKIRTLSKAGDYSAAMQAFQPELQV